MARITINNEKQTYLDLSDAEITEASITINDAFEKAGVHFSMNGELQVCRSASRKTVNSLSLPHLERDRAKPKQNLFQSFHKSHWKIKERNKTRLLSLGCLVDAID